MTNSETSANSSLAFPKPKTPRNEKYKKYVSTFRCCVCYAPAPSDPHHLPLKGQGAKGMKCSDYRVIPLCYRCHSDYHNLGRDTFQLKHKQDFEAIIDALNKRWIKDNGKS